ncbi:trypsin-like serine protease [Pedobacter sp. HMF7647]|uniref:Trypsin-like serine protease n=1 Tax=Hufsiella arboris TaxID=2695275 RepID=A0A7K1Y9B4_9SPHI|nr:serine protease [Hufsiella arboris]MXV51193.1 trypsin-like serine protease [Hufsiella arboris]
MNTEMELINQIEAYLRGEMPAEERRAFEQLRTEDPVLNAQVVAHLALMKELADYGKNLALKRQMNRIHQSMNIEAIRSSVIKEPAMVVVMWKKYRASIGIAASVAILAVFTTLFSVGVFNEKKADYNALRRVIEMDKRIDNITKSQNALLRDMKPHAPTIPAKYGGTGFALTTNGYVLTNYHVISGADSVYVQNTDGEAFKAKTVYSDKESDVAILKIVDSNFKNYNSLPYTFKKTSDLGEDVYTIGFSKDEPVIGSGILSSRNGYSGDTTAYQVSMPVNNGNSGGPLIDPRGNIIGIVKGKQDQIEGAAFAVKTDFILKAINDIPEDSLTSKLVINKKNALAGLNRPSQIKKIRDYIFMVKVY